MAVTKRIAKTAPTPEPGVEEVEEVEEAVEEVAEEATDEVVADAEATPAVKRTRRTPTAMFEIVGEELPANPKRKGGGGGGGGKSKWIKILQRIANDAPVGSWVVVQEFPTSTGATNAKRNMEKGVEAGKITFPEVEGVTWEVEPRRKIVTVHDDDTDVDIEQRVSYLAIRKVAVEAEGDADSAE